VASKNNGVIKGNGDSGGGEDNGTAGIAELAHREEGRRSKIRDNVNMACS
jgi:hypothetical protein